MIESVDVGSGELSVYFVEDVKSRTSHKQADRIALIFYGAPSAPHYDGVDSDLFLESFATRLASSANGLVGVVQLRGVGASDGVFSPLGWTQDVQGICEYLCNKNPGARVFLIGFELASIACLAAATELDQVAGVATISIVASIPPYNLDCVDLSSQLANLGVRVPKDLLEIKKWQEEFEAIDPILIAPRLGSTPWLVIHGTNDRGVTEDAVRILLDEVAGFGELHMVNAGADSLRADPRVLALLSGWIARIDT